ncbi:MAG: hypothetical protein PHS73_01615 [Candidatus Peribacteraceae bacterium]|nr:hypothetical protein [Candidatus Peribacteraceae bacterium]
MDAPQAVPDESEHTLETSEEAQSSVLSNILRLERLRPLSLFSTGHSGCNVILTKTDSGQFFVVKAPTDQHSQQEIIDNIHGYREMVTENVGDMVPQHHIGHAEDRTYLVMEYLGDDFASASRSSEQPESLYESLRRQMVGIYRRTTKQDGKCGPFLERVHALLQRNLHEVARAGLVRGERVTSALDIDKKDLATDTSCFGVFDFTPEDIFLTETGIRYPDPKHSIRGNPIIDLACFAGVAKDILHLPGSSSGYEKLEEYAVNEVSEILHLTALQARRIFGLGRALQCSLSSRFRLKSDPALATTYAERSLDSLGRVSDI